MARLGYRCDECGDEYPDHHPAASVRVDGEWRELCSDCYDDHLDETGRKPIGGVA